MQINNFISRKIEILNFAFGILILLTFSDCSKPQSISKERYSKIQKGFITPQDTNRVWCYYYWLGDDISKEGVTKDLKAMKEFGIGAALIGNINPDEEDGPVPLFSENWWDIMVHAVNEGHRLGIDIGFFNCPGWSQSGGPWITPDKAMRHLVYSETEIKQSGEVQLKLEKPADIFQDTYVLAFRTIKAEYKKLDRNNSQIDVQPSVKNALSLIDGDFSNSGLFSLNKSNQYTLNFHADKKINARSIVLYPGKEPFKCNCKLYAWDGNEKQLVRSFEFDRSNVAINGGPLTHGPVAIAFPVVSSEKFQLVCTNLSSDHKNVGFTEIEIGERAVLEKYVEKSLGKMHPTPFPSFYSYMWGQQNKVKNEKYIVDKVLDISNKMDSQGSLRWEVPEGNWTVMRIGMTPTGTKNAPAAPQGKGYEVDKASEELVRFHFRQYIGEILDRIPEKSRSAFKYVIADSYEMSSQNWTDGFAKKFESKYGYNPVKFLPVLSGRIVESVEQSERFLWDLRRAVADDVAYEYVGGLRKISNEHNLKLWLENYGHWGFPGEFLMYGGQSNLVSGEYWNEGELGNTECKSASSAAHIYGKPITSAEAFTAAWDSYERHPALLKTRGDWSLTEGINHYVLHLYTHQPDDDRVPGINAEFSTEFNRHNTWFVQGEAWVDYLRRCQNMLQQGKYAADVCYFIGEDVPKMTGTRDPELPDGYSYDYINAEVILDRLSIEDGKFVLPDGMSYKLLVLPNIETMRPQVLSKIEELVKEGGLVLGPKPKQSPSLENYPEADKKVKRIADRLWIDDYHDGKLIHSYGKGYLVDGTGIQEALDIIDVEKDVDLQGDTSVLWTHRKLSGMEIYFLTNQNTNKAVHIKPSFRIKGMNPQLWDPVAGQIRSLNDFTCANGRTIVPLELQAKESMFVVFTNHENEIVSPGYQQNFPEFQSVLELTGSWHLEFNNKDIAPEDPLVIEHLMDWTKFNDQQIKYYSGTATYRKQFKIDKIPQNADLFLDLGNVGVMAEVKLNGKDLGVSWIKPYVLPIHGALKAGKNTLEIKAVNTWRNKMIQDNSLPQEERYTWTIFEDVEPDEELNPSGLIGPVSVKRIETDN